MGTTGDISVSETHQTWIMLSTWFVVNHTSFYIREQMSLGSYGLPEKVTADVFTCYGQGL